MELDQADRAGKADKVGGADRGDFGRRPENDDF